MSQDYFISNAGKGGALAPDKQELLQAFILSLPSLEGHESDQRRFRFSNGWNTLSYKDGGLLVSVGATRDQTFMRDFYRLVVYARGIGLNLFGDSGDPDDEFDWELVVRMFEGHTGHGLSGG